MVLLFCASCIKGYSSSFSYSPFGFCTFTFRTYFFVCRSRLSRQLFHADHTKVDDGPIVPPPPSLLPFKYICPSPPAPRPSDSSGSVHAHARRARLASRPPSLPPVLFSFSREPNSFRSIKVIAHTPIALAHRKSTMLPSSAYYLGRCEIASQAVTRAREKNKLLNLAPCLDEEHRENKPQ